MSIHVGPFCFILSKSLMDLQCKSCGLYSLIALSVNYAGANLRVKFPNVGLRASLQPGDVEKHSQACCIQCPSAVTRLVSFSADSTRLSTCGLFSVSPSFLSHPAHQYLCIPHHYHLFGSSGPQHIHLNFPGPCNRPQNLSTFPPFTLIV